MFPEFMAKRKKKGKKTQLTFPFSTGDKIIFKRLSVFER